MFTFGSLAALTVLVVAPPAPTGATCSLEGTSVSVPSFAVTSLAPAAFQSLHQAVAPHGTGERWTEIPWRTDLSAARREAAQEGKPLFMWVMDGHPLGCT